MDEKENSNHQFGYVHKIEPNTNSTIFLRDLEHYLTGNLWSGQIEKCEWRMENFGAEASVGCTLRTIRSLRSYADLQAQDP